MQAGSTPVSHDCQRSLCDTPHYDDCYCDNCDICHESHILTDWAVMPECGWCAGELDEWANEIETEDIQ